MIKCKSILKAGVCLTWCRTSCINIDDNKAFATSTYFVDMETT